MHRATSSRASNDVSPGPAQRYTEGFDNIRRLQRYVKSQALSHGVPIIPNYNFDQALAAVIDLVMERATGPGRSSSTRATAPRAGRKDTMRLFLDTGKHRGDPRDQPLGRARPA